MKTVQSYNISEIRTLVDLNGIHKNFELSFNVTSRDSKPFEAIVVDNVSLEENNIPEYKSASDGIMTGKIKSDNGTYFNYYLLLKADESTQVEVEIDLTPLPESENLDLAENNSAHDEIDESTKTNLLDKKFFGISLKIILLVALIIVIAGFVYYTFFYKTNKRVDVDSIVDDEPLNLIHDNKLNTDNNDLGGIEHDLRSISVEPPINNEIETLSKHLSDNASVVSENIPVTTISQHSTPQRTISLLEKIENLPEI